MVKNNTTRITQRKGDVAVSRAVSTFTRLGYDVALPFTESASYDLVVDIGRDLKKVQVRFAGNGEVDLRRIHSNSNGYVIKKPKAKSYDWLYVLDGEEREYLIKECPVGRRSIKPQSKHLIENVSKKS